MSMNCYARERGAWPTPGLPTASAPRRSTTCSPGLWTLGSRRSRPPRELSGIFAAIETTLGRLAEDRRIRCHAVRVRAVDKLELLPDATLAAVRAAEAATADQRGMTSTARSRRRPMRSSTP